MACQKYLGKNYGAVMLLAGPPGVGKTSIAVSIAKAMGRPCVKISLAGVSDALFLRGTQTVFNNAKPGRIVDALVHGKSFCPLILLDEIDKMGSSIEHGCPENVLLDILDLSLIHIYNDGSSEHFTCSVDVGKIMLSCIPRRQIHRRRTLPDAPVHHTPR